MEKKFIKNTIQTANVALSESVENKIIAAPFRQKLNFLSYDQKLTFLYTPCQSIFVYSYACMTIIITSIFQMGKDYICVIYAERIVLMILKDINHSKHIPQNI